MGTGGQSNIAMCDKTAPGQVKKSIENGRVYFYFEKRIKEYVLSFFFDDKQVDLRSLKVKYIENGENKEDILISEK